MTATELLRRRYACSSMHTSLRIAVQENFLSSPRARFRRLTQIGSPSAPFPLSQQSNVQDKGGLR